MNLQERLRSRKRFWSMDGSRWYMDSKPDEDCEEAAAELDRLQARVAELEALLHRIEPYIDGIVCYASTMDEYEPNRIAHDLRTAIDTARKAKP
jgi:hypothetical protein